MSKASKNRIRKNRARYKAKAKSMTEGAIASGRPTEIFNAALEISHYHHKYNHHHLKTLEDAIIATGHAEMIKNYALKVKKCNYDRLLNVAKLMGADVTLEDFEQAAKPRKK